MEEVYVFSMPESLRDQLLRILTESRGQLDLFAAPCAEAVEQAQALSTSLHKNQDRYTAPEI